MEFVIPDKVQVGGLDFSVAPEPGLALNEGKLAACAFGDLHIRYLPGRTAQQMQESVLHEFIHAVNETWDIGLKESQVKRLSAGLYQVIRQLQADIGRPNLANIERDLVHGLPGG